LPKNCGLSTIAPSRCTICRQRGRGGPPNSASGRSRARPDRAGRAAWWSCRSRSARGIRGPRPGCTTMSKPLSARRVPWRSVRKVLCRPSISITAGTAAPFPGVPMAIHRSAWRRPYAIRPRPAVLRESPGRMVGWARATCRTPPRRQRFPARRGRRAALADIVIAVDRATVTRGGNDLLHNVTWRVELDERWVILGPNGAGKTTLLNLASARMHPTRAWSGARRAAGPGGHAGAAHPHRALHSLAARPHPPDESVLNVVVTAAWSVVGRFRENYDPPTPARARAAGAGRHGRYVDGATARSPRASASGCRSPARDDRPGAACCSTSRRPGWTWAAGRTSCGAWRAGRRSGLADAGARHPPRGGDPAVVQPRAAAAEGPWSRRACSPTP
jgi:energy-coupling factor transporter ATP-binding protein EcfA2